MEQEQNATAAPVDLTGDAPIPALGPDTVLMYSHKTPDTTTDTLRNVNDEEPVNLFRHLSYMFTMVIYAILSPLLN